MRDSLLPSWNTDVIQTTCSLLVMFVKKLGVLFCPFANQVVVPLLHAGCKIRRTSEHERLADPELGAWTLVEQKLWQSAETCLDEISTASRYELTPLLDVYDAAGTDDDDDGMLVSIRCLALKQVGLVHRAWTKAELVPYYERVRAMLRDAMVEPNFFSAWQLARRSATFAIRGTAPSPRRRPHLACRDEHMDELVQILAPDTHHVFL